MAALDVELLSAREEMITARENDGGTLKHYSMEESAALAANAPDGSIPKERQNCISQYLLDEAKQYALQNGTGCYQATLDNASKNNPTECEKLYEVKFRGDHRVRNYGTAFDLLGEVHSCYWKYAIGQCDAGGIVMVCPEEPYEVMSVPSSVTDPGNTLNKIDAAVQNWGPGESRLDALANAARRLNPTPNMTPGGFAAD